MSHDLSELKDGMFWQLMEDLSGCLCTMLAEAGGPELCFCGVIPGSDVDTMLATLGRCDGGMAWVRLDTSFPSTTFPQPDQLASCTTLMAAVLEVGVLRPVMLGTDRRAPSMDELVAATRLQLSDRTAMQKAIQCCVTGTDVDFVYLMGDYSPEGPQGGLVGGSWTLTIQQGI